MQFSHSLNLTHSNSRIENKRHFEKHVAYVMVCSIVLKYSLLNGKSVSPKNSMFWVRRIAHLTDFTYMNSTSDYFLWLEIGMKEIVAYFFLFLDKFEATIIRMLSDKIIPYSWIQNKLYRKNSVVNFPIDKSFVMKAIYRP